MADMNDLRDPWLVAVWPGMGHVALLAGGYLVQQLEAQPVTELPAAEFFEVQQVQVKDGLVTAAPLPQNLFFEWRDPRGQRDLLIFVGEAQPTTGGYLLCQKAIEYAVRRGVRRVFTFAAMATQLQLGTKPRVFAAATDRPGVDELKRTGVELMEEGQISGLNGVLLAAGVERGLRGMCLLGELPYFAVGVANPRAALAVLEPFIRMAGLEIDLTDLRRQAKMVESQLKQLLEQMSQQGGLALNEEGDEWKIATDDEEEDAEAEPSQEPQKAGLDPRIGARIEMLFERARRDRSKAVELKQELDRLGIFEQYEDRFLDLFRKAD